MNWLERCWSDGIRVREVIQKNNIPFPDFIWMLNRTAEDYFNKKDKRKEIFRFRDRSIEKLEDNKKDCLFLEEKIQKDRKIYGQRISEEKIPIPLVFLQSLQEDIDNEIFSR